MTTDPKLILGAFLRDESSCFLEWLAYHRVIGASDFHIFVDQASGDERPLFDALMQAGVIKLHAITADAELREEDRNSALRFAELEQVEGKGYGLFLKPDEYFRINSRSKTVQSLMRACRSADVLSAPVETLGFDRRVEHVPGPVLADDRPKDDLSERETRDITFRSVARLGLFGARNLETPTGPTHKTKGLSWVNGDGNAMPEPFSRIFWNETEDLSGTEKASIVKLPAPSLDTFMLRTATLRHRQRPDADTMAEELDELASFSMPDTGFNRWMEATAAEIDALLALPGVAEAQERITLLEKQRLDALRARPSDIATLMATARDEEPPKRARRRRAKDAVEAPVEPPAKEITDDLADDLDPQTPPNATSATLPEWLAEIHTSGTQQGFFARLAHHAVLCIRRSDKHLVVTFDNLSNVNDMSVAREPWAYKFVRDNGFSHLSVMARRKDWYRDPELIAYLQQLSAAGFFRHFGKVTFTGTSMGGFAALAFSSLSPGATVLSFNPQTTLDPQLVPWERRFRLGRDRNWALPFSDCAFEIEDAAKVFVFYDPFFVPDRRHVDRLTGPNVTRLKTWCSGHFSPVFLRRANLLKPIMQHGMEGTLTPEIYYQMFRDRRTLPWYRKSLETNLTERGHTELAKRVIPAFRKLRREAAE